MQASITRRIKNVNISGSCVFHYVISLPQDYSSSSSLIYRSLKLKLSNMEKNAVSYLVGTCIYTRNSLQPYCKDLKQ